MTTSHEPCFLVKSEFDATDLQNLHAGNLQPFNLRVKPSDTIQRVRSRIAARKGIPAQAIQLTSQGSTLEDDQTSDNHHIIA